MGRGWKAARAMFASNFCVNPPDEEEERVIGSDDIHTLEDLLALDAAANSSKSNSTRGRSASAGRRRSFLRIHKSTCSICLDPMAPGAGHALFTAECSHTFHFSCIASNARHGNLICPVCRAKWVDIPWQQQQHQHAEFSKILASRRSSARSIARNLQQQQQPVDPVLRILNESIANAQRARHGRGGASAEPAVYNDDEECLPGIQQPHASAGAAAGDGDDRRLKVSAFAENPSVAAAESRDPFTVLVNIKAPSSSRVRRTSTSSNNSSNPSPSPNRAPIDLVTVLDVSGSMAGSKLALLKSAMEFVIGHLSSRDRLSVIAFSTNATRLFPLKRMVEQGKAAAVRSVEALAASGGTNIGEALKKAAKILQDRRLKNSVSSIMLLSDGQDTASSSSLFGGVSSAAASSFLISSSSLSAPVHAFGFGSDHDPTKMHAIAEATGGTFSFIRSESFVRDAFAQCIGGLLSVVSQGVEVSVSGSSSARLLRIEQGGFTSRLSEDGSSAVISLGDLYAEEERDILVQITLNSSRPASSVEIARIQCSYRDALHPQELLEAEPVALSIARPEFIEESEKGTSLEVDKQRNRLLASESIARAGILADAGDLGGAQAAIADARRRIEQSAAFLSGDALSKSLHSELHEVLTRMENRRIYQESGRAYALSAHSSHYRQRATMRMDPDDDDDVYSHSYQTSSMAEMVHLSQSFSGTIGGHSNGRSHSSNKDGGSSLVAKIVRSRSSRKVNPSSS